MTDGSFRFFNHGEGLVCVHKRRQLQQQLQLRPIQPFAAGTKHPPHQQVYLLPQQFILPARLR